MAKFTIYFSGKVLKDVPVYKDWFYLGRFPDCDVYLPDSSVSRRHAEIGRQGKDYYIEDLESMNGTFVNDARVARHVLSDGDSIVVGKFRLHFHRELELDGLAPRSETSDVVRVENVSKEYHLGKQTVTALKNISLTVRGEEFLALAGPSGSGKSTLLNLIGCIDTPTEGAIYIGEDEVSTKTPDELADLRARTLGFIFQTLNLLPVLSAWAEFP